MPYNEMKRIQIQTLIIISGVYYPFSCNAAGIVGGIQVAGTLVVLAIIYGVLSLLVGLLITYPIYKKIRKAWIWAISLIPSVLVFLGLWIFTFSPYAKPIFSVINDIFGTNL